MHTRHVWAAVVLLFGISTFAFAPPAVPEIHPDSTSAALSMIGAAALIIRSRRKRS
jgi:hypothetical protein